MSVYIVEDHPVMQQMLRVYIERSGGFSVAGVASSGEDALAAWASTRPDLALVDLSLPGMSGIDLITTCASTYPDLPCLILSGHKEQAYVQQALDAGARGYILKGNPQEVRVALQKVLDEEIYLSPALQAA